MSRKKSAKDSEKYFQLRGQIVAQNEDAWMLKIPGSEKRPWVPKIKIKDGHSYDLGEEATFFVEYNFARSENLFRYVFSEGGFSAIALKLESENQRVQVLYEEDSIAYIFYVSIHDVEDPDMCIEGTRIHLLIPGETMSKVKADPSTTKTPIDGEVQLRNRSVADEGATEEEDLFPPSVDFAVNESDGGMPEAFFPPPPESDDRGTLQLTEAHVVDEPAPAPPAEPAPLPFAAPVQIHPTGGFEQHGLTHVSPSSINTWINAPDVWVAEKLFGYKRPTGSAANRGQAVEAAVFRALTEGSGANVGEMAEREFDRIVSFDDGKQAKERGLLGSIAQNAFEALAPLGAPVAPEEGGQFRVEAVASTNDFIVPMIGYLDFLFPGKKIVDLKTTMRILTRQPVEHSRQHAFYSAVTQIPVEFLYVSDKKTLTQKAPDVGRVMRDTKEHIIRLERFLRGRTREEIRDLISVNTSTFYWSGAENVAKELYGVEVL